MVRAARPHRISVPPHRAAFVGFPQQLWMQMVSFLLFFTLPGQSLYFPRILQFLFFHESIYSKRAKCNQNHSSLRMPLYIAFKK